MSTLQLNIGDCWEVGGQRHYLDQVMGGGFLLLRSERTAAPLQIELDSGEQVSPTTSWLLDQFAAGKARRLDGPVANTRAQRIALEREDDVEAILARDGRALIRQTVLTALDRVPNLSLSAEGLRRALAAIWTSKPRRLEGQKPPGPSTVRRWLKERGQVGARPLAAMVSMKGRVPRAKRLPLSVHRKMYKAAMAYWADPSQTKAGSYDVLIRRLRCINRRLQEVHGLKVPLPSQTTFYEAPGGDGKL